MEHPFFPMTTTRAEALRWLSIAEKLLSARDLVGSKSFAARARDADPTLSPAEQILAVADTLLAGDIRIGNNHHLHDLYAILRLTPQQGRNADLVARQYRSLALILNPQKNTFPFAEQAFALVVDAWSVLSNPSRKSMYDKELAFYLQPPPPPPPPPQQQQQLHADLFGNPSPTMHHNIFNPSGVNYPNPSQGVTYSQSHGAVHFPQLQVHCSSPVGPTVGEPVPPVRVVENVMHFTTGSSIAFGAGLGGKAAGDEPANKAVHESYPSFASNVSENHERQPRENFNVNENCSNVGEGSGDDVNVNENCSNVGEGSGNDVNVNENCSNVGEGSDNDVNVNEGIEENEEAQIEEDVGGMEGEEDVERMEGLEEMDAPADGDEPSFWTACPYCYYMYEYPSMYVDCTLRCSNCKMAFQAVEIPAPPPMEDGRDGYFCCWGFFPLGFSMETWEKNKCAASSWTPFSPMFSCLQASNPKRAARKSTEPRIYVDDDEVFVEFSDSSESDDDDWSNNKPKRKKKAANVRGKGSTGTPNRSAKKAQIDKGKNVDLQDGIVSPNALETPNMIAGDTGNKGAAVSARKQPARAAKNFGKLDLNVECSNEAEELPPRVNEESGPAHGGDDNIEGIGFFEGLDEFLSSLPILNGVGDDKVVKGT